MCYPPISSGGTIQYNITYSWFQLQLKSNTIFLHYYVKAAECWGWHAHRVVSGTCCCVLCWWWWCLPIVTELVIKLFISPPTPPPPAAVAVFWVLRPGLGRDAFTSSPLRRLKSCNWLSRRFTFESYFLLHFSSEWFNVLQQVKFCYSTKPFSTPPLLYSLICMLQPGHCALHLRILFFGRFRGRLHATG